MCIEIVDVLCTEPKRQYAQSSSVSCSLYVTHPDLTKGSRCLVQKSTSCKSSTPLALQDRGHKELSSCFLPVVNLRTK